MTTSRLPLGSWLCRRRDKLWCKPWMVLLVITTYILYGTLTKPTTPHHRIQWDNNLLYYHKVAFGVKVTKRAKSVDYRRARVPHLGELGRVVFAKEGSANITNTIAKVSDTIYLPPVGYICRDAPVDQRTRMVLATTMYFSNATDFLTNNTLRNWAGLRPYVQPVLYITPSDTQPTGPESVRRACRLGWHVYVVPESNVHNFPVLRSMMEHVRRTYTTTPMIGYANGDIIFDASLPQTLEFFWTHHHKFITKKYHLITGIRTDIEIRRGRELYKAADVAEAAALEGVPHGASGADYFFSTRNGYPWAAIPPFVVGRPTFDNWLLWWSDKELSPAECLDATGAITALHVSEKGAPAGWKHRDVDKGYNRAVAPPFPAYHGNTACLPRKLLRIRNATSLLPNVTPPGPNVASPAPNVASPVRNIASLPNVTPPVRNVASPVPNVTSTSLKFAVIRMRVKVTRARCWELKEKEKLLVIQGEIPADFVNSSDFNSDPWI